jgi:hypothetical protein
MANAIANITFNGLGTYNYHVPVAGLIIFDAKINLPSISQGNSANSSVVVTINQNSSLKYTGVAGAEGFYLQLPCSANDSIDFILTSADAVDQGLNKVKTTVSIY